MNPSPGYKIIATIQREQTDRILNCPDLWLEKVDCFAVFNNAITKRKQTGMVDTTVTEKKGVNV